MPSPVIDMEPVGAAPAVQPAPAKSIDLSNVEWGRDTFRNPMTWLLLGVVATLAVQYVFRRLDR